MIKKKKIALRTETIRTMTGAELLEIKGGAPALCSLCNSHINGCNDPDAMTPAK
jgi:hypothetical protein